MPFIFPDRAFQPLLYDQLFSVFEEPSHTTARPEFLSPAQAGGVCCR